jgi:prolipoprotein diacylglyceryl transferase
VILHAVIVASIPSPSGNGFSIGPFDLRAYGLMIALGVIAAVWLLGRQLVAKGIGTADDASSIAIWSVGAGIIGARLYHVATDWYRFSDNLGAIPKIWEGGLGIPGGLLAGILMGAWQAKRRNIPVAMLMTCAAPAIPLAQAIGRWGNWFNQELYGKPTDLPWALEIDDKYLEPGYASGTTFHPTFLYESLWNFGLVAVLLWIDRKLRLGPGRLMAVYVMGYGLGRFWIEGLRIDESRDLAGLRWNQWVALAAVVGGALYLVITHGQKWPEPEPADAVSADTEPDAPEPADAESADTEPDDAMPDDATSADTEPDAPEPADAESADTEPDDAMPDDAMPDDAMPDESLPDLGPDDRPR